ncbi:hypothetical protein TUM12370_09400 [Salmonella enterica subsp. enterica serovar Choleraesuis]|nr:hypothetical protein TUM12370_09400 [Salmonella enterica subsp. enterica serovar Choleraesuis]
MVMNIGVMSGDPISAINSVCDAVSSSLRVALPGTIDSFDPQSVTCTVTLGVLNTIRGDDGNWRSSKYSQLVDVPVVFPRGGGCTLTFPLAAGDECLVVFADRSIDSWWQSGGTQETSAGRQHSLSDAFVLPGPQSQVRKISNISTESTQLRTDDGQAFIELAQNHDVAVTTSGSITLSASQVTVNGPVAINGSLTVSQDATAAGISLINHVHSGVQGGSSTTGKPQ